MTYSDLEKPVTPLKISTQTCGDLATLPRMRDDGLGRLALKVAVVVAVAFVTICVLMFLYGFFFGR